MLVKTADRRVPVRVLRYNVTVTVTVFVLRPLLKTDGACIVELS